MLNLILLMTVLVEAGCMIALLLLILCIIRHGQEDFGLFRHKKPKMEPKEAPEEPEPRRKSVDEGIDNLMTYSLDVAKENRRGREEWP